MITKKDLLEAIKDMPMDAEICIREYDYAGEWIRDLKLENIVFDENNNDIVFG